MQEGFLGSSWQSRMRQGEYVLMTCGGTDWYVLRSLTWLTRLSVFWKILQGMNKTLENH